jgi:hypothetical protein
VPRWIEREWLRRAAVIALATLWCLPYLHARTSSENLGGSLLALGIAALAWRGAAAGFGAGCLLGLGFELRFQTGFAVLGLVLCGLAIERWPARRALSVGAGILAMIALGTALDSQAYGAFTFAPWNYFEQNVLEGRMLGFGRERPWWYYPNRAANVLVPVSTLLVALVAVACVRHWRHPLVWAVVAFVIGHSAAGRKSLRFLFPLAPLAPVLAAMALDRWRVRGRELTRASFRRPALRVLLAVCLLVNAAGLAAATLLPPRYPTGLYAYLYERAPRPLEIHFARGHPFSSKLPMAFYHADWIALRPAASLDDVLARAEAPLLLYDEAARLPASLAARCALVHASHPRWLRESRWLQQILGRPSLRMLYRCSRPE